MLDDNLLNSLFQPVTVKSCPNIGHYVDWRKLFVGEDKLAQVDIPLNAAINVHLKPA